ncbi:MAG: GTPase Era [Candidatus Omnitrophota bacterium]|nr:MAG: GTPase Era [Candidatus Omnitrophota bacterium]
MKTTAFKSGFVAMLGRPNVGKSTLLNALLGSKISIVSPVPQTTRHKIKGILNLENAQVVFVDTPGLHSFRDSLVRHLNTLAKQALVDCDLILYVVDICRPIGKEEEAVMEILARQKVKIIMVLNKRDLGEKFINDYIGFWEKKIKKAPLVYYVPVSAKTGKNVDMLRNVIVRNLPQNPAFYDKDTVTDFPVKFRIADIVREKLFLNLGEELPHSLAVEVQHIEKKKRIVHVLVNIYINRSSQKKIVVGKRGEVLKIIGVAARPQIEEIFNKKVYLGLWVKVVSDWQKRPRILQELGYY